MATGLQDFIRYIINGLQLGSVYALVALGYTMVYGIVKLINFAHGDFIMVGGYISVITIPFWPCGACRAGCACLRLWPCVRSSAS